VNSPERILLTYFSRPPILDYLGKAFQRLGIEVRAVNAEENSWFDRFVIHRLNKLAHNLRLLPKDRQLFSRHPLAHYNYRSRRLLDAYNEFQPNLVLVIRGPGIRPEVLAQTRPLFGWWIEHDHRREIIGELGLYDRFFFINQSLVREARNAGFSHVDALSHAVDPESFHPITGLHKSIDVCFVGGWSPRRQRYLQAALSVTRNIVIYGGKWAKRCGHLPDVLRCWQGPYIEGEALNTLYNQSRIVLNVTNWGRDNHLHSGMTMRIVEVPASGTFLLSDVSEEMSGMFAADRHIGVFRNVDEFPEKLAYWLTHDAERDAVAAAGLAQVLGHHTYDRMAEKIIGRYRALAECA
jgi:glycosyltransferase involved in cell wall biosynthesis